ncbi:hypothetical protein J1N35_042591 [Gossypium stocksii]|uniref:Uncharacterized protein n=1 Tax=Gossypium stocksii TaxID=47602 RepID=A0A9D3U5U1_9ROSI|nr:hypothetical protein J1N35_042591 [Gossypium stocksii]
MLVLMSMRWTVVHGWWSIDAGISRFFRKGLCSAVALPPLFSNFLSFDIFVTSNTSISLALLVGEALRRPVIGFSIAALEFDYCYGGGQFLGCGTTDRHPLATMSFS